MTVTYIDFGLTSVEDYWDKLVVPAVKEFQNKPSPMSVFNAALSVWHLHEWVWHDRNPNQTTKRNPAFNDHKNKLLMSCPELGWLQDITDAGKHRGLGRSPEVKSAHPHQPTGRRAIYQNGLSGGGPAMSFIRGPRKFLVVLKDGSKHDMADVLRTATDFWCNELKPKKLLSPFA